MMSKIVKSQMSVHRLPIFLKSSASSKSNNLSSTKLFEYPHNKNSWICTQVCSNTVVKYSATPNFTRISPSYTKINDARLSGILLNPGMTPNPR